MTLSQLKIAIEEKIKTHKRAIDNIPWSSQKKEIEVKIDAFKEVIGMIDGPNNDNTPDCNCKQHKIWHWCPFHNWCNPSTGIGV